MLFSDAHLHTNPVSGLGMRSVARKFKSRGGWFVALVSLPPYHYGITELSVDAYRKALEILQREARIAKEEGLEVVKLAGIHPAEIEELYRRNVKGRTLLELAEKVLGLYEAALRNGELDGLGEFGRQHFTTSPERLVASELVTMRALELARDYDVVVHLHLEQGGWATCASINAFAGFLKLNKRRVVIHHANLETAKCSEELGFPYTIPVKRLGEGYLSLRNELALVESDFIDDPHRPGVAAYPWEIPEVIGKSINEGSLSEDKAYRLMVDNVSKVFGISP